MKIKTILKTSAFTLGVGFILAGSGVAIIATNFLVKNLKGLEAINPIELSQSPNSEIYANDGKTLIWTNSEYQHKPLAMKDTPKVLVDLLLSTEDKTFYQNEGFSRTGLFNSALSVVKDKLFHTNSARGGSSITMQLIKNMRYMDSSLSEYDRKIQEIALAKRLTDSTKKDVILEAYLNKVGFLESSYGFNTAFFLLYGEEINKDKTSPADIAKYATIVGMLQNPSIYNPRTNPDATEKRRNQVLLSAYEDKKITKAQYDEAKATHVTDGLKDQGWFTQQVYQVASSNGAYVNSILKQLADKGYNLKNNQKPIKVISNLNIKENEWLQQEVQKPTYYANDRQQVAVTVIEPKTGKVLAQIGNRNGATATDLNRANQLTRSSGSTIKPFLDYAPLIEFGNIGPNSTWNGNQTTYAGTNVIVRNYGGYTYGTVTTQFALKMSLNVPAVEALTMQQPWMNQTIMQNLGLADHKVNDDGSLSSVNTYGGSQALGINTSTSHMASAFATLANNGLKTEPLYIQSVTQDGQTIELKNDPTPSMSPRTAYQLLSMLKTTTEQGGSAASAAINDYKGYAVKTGTVGYDDNAPIYADEAHTQFVGTVGSLGIPLLATDSWMAGTTKSVATAVWTGFDDQAHYGDWIDEKNQTRSDIFVAIMKHFNEGKDTSDFVPTDARINLTRKEAPKQLEVSQIVEALQLPNLKLQTVQQNDQIATASQKDFYNRYQKDQLLSPYDGIKTYYENNNILGYALKKDNKDSNTHLYTINEAGQVTSE